jgi:transcriptional regulator with XRE-family HTH domain
MLPASPVEICPYNPQHASLEDCALAKQKGSVDSQPDDSTRAIGERLARFRKERGITQVEMAELLGVSQPNVSDYERGELRLHGEMLIKLARVLRVSADEILGLHQSPPARAPRDRRLLRRLQDVDRLSKRDRQALLRTLDAFLSKAQA